MIVVNQKTKPIRSPSSPAQLGSHGTRTATAVAIPPATAPISTSWTIEPLRTGRGDYPTPDRGCGRRRCPYPRVREPRFTCERETNATPQEVEFMGLGVSLILIAAG